MSDLLQRLGYRLPEPRGAQTLLRRVVSGRAFTEVNARLLHHVDRWTHRMTGGRATLTSAVAGLPVIFLTTTGARSGLLRTAPLIAIPIDGALGVIGSNFGGSTHPGWVHNLVAHPHGVVRFQRMSVPVTARPAHRDEHDRIWDVAGAVYAGYARYRAWAGEREIRVFVLDADQTAI